MNKKYKNNKIFESIYQKDFLAFNSKPNVTNARKVFKVSKIEGIKANPWAAPSKKTACGEVYRVSIAPVGADKWDGVKHIADYYGIDAEDIYTFGDMWNDFGMIENAGHGYALKGSDADRQMKNKNVTRFSCAEDGVAEVIEREILKLHD